MISQTAEYALRAIVYLADQGGVARTTSEIAETTQVPAGYLAKVMQSLCRAGLVKSQRGLNGGFKLAHDPRRALGPGRDQRSRSDPAICRVPARNPQPWTAALPAASPVGSSCGDG